MALDDDFDRRLSRIETHWTLHLKAHADGDRALQAELLHRYRSAAYRYLRAAVKDADAADDLAQEFALRFLRGDFRGADPGRGRFRDYLRVSLSRLATDFHRAKAKQAEPLAVEPAAKDASEADAAYDSSWRQEVLDRTWNALEAASPAACAALRLKVENADWTSAQLAEALTRERGEATTPEAVRKAIQRGHEKFADLLVAEVEATLERPNRAALVAELEDLGLLRYCRSALERTSPS